MKAQRNHGKVMHEQNSQVHDSASPPYLVEAALDQEWEENYRNGNSRKTASVPRTSSHRMQTNQFEAEGQEGGLA